MKYSKIIILIFITTLLFPGAMNAQYSIAKSVFGSGGTSIGNSSNTFMGTLGQCAAFTIHNTSNEVRSGFWHRGESDIIHYQSFDNDNGSMPSGWSIDHDDGTVDWVLADGGNSRNPSSARSGDYNALFHYPSTDGYSSKLVMPMLNFGSLTVNPQLKFWHAMAANGGDVDQLRVYYKTSAGGAWILLKTYTAEVSGWTLRTLTLPNPGSTYYIAFDGTALNGYGVCIDDVTLTGCDPACYTNLYLENLSYSKPSMRTFRASNNIYVSNTGGGFDIDGDGSAGANIAMSAGNRVIMKAGFLADKGSRFKAIIDTDPCDIFIDFDKQSTIREEEPIEIDPNKMKFATGINIYPNPVFNIVNLKINTDPRNIRNIEIFTLPGSGVFSISYPGVNELQINMSDFPNGMYILRIKLKDEILTGKIIKK